MYEGAHNFTWHRLDGRGQQYVIDSGTKHLIEREAAGSRRWPYKPLKDFHNLYLLLAQCLMSEEGIPSEEGILSFAERFGLLEESKLGRLGEPLSLWTDEIKEMRFSLELWECVQAKNIDRLREILEPIKGQPKVILIGPPAPQEQHKAHSALWDHLNAPLPQSNDPIEAALHYLSAVFDQRLRDRLRAAVVPSNGPSPLVFDVVPQDLIGAIWLQFAHRVSGNKRLKHCDFCQKYFEPKRSTKKFCSEKCKVAAYKRRKRASEAAANGDDHGENS